MKHYLLQEETINLALNILAKLPYVDVHTAITAIQRECTNQPEWEFKQEKKDEPNKQQ